MAKTKTFFDAIRQGQAQRVDDTIRAAEYNRLVDIETRNTAASRLSSGRENLRGIAQDLVKNNQGSDNLRNFATGSNSDFNSAILNEVDELAGDRFNSTSFLNDTLFSAAGTGNNRVALANLGLDFDRKEAIIDLMSRDESGQVLQVPLTKGATKYSAGGEQQPLKIEELDRMLRSYQQNLLPSIDSLSGGFALTDPNAQQPGVAPKPELITKLEEDPNYVLTKQEEQSLLNDPYVKQLFKDQNIDSVDDLGKPGTFNPAGQDLNLNRENIEESLQTATTSQTTPSTTTKIGIDIPEDDVRSKLGYRRVFETSKIAEKLGVDEAKAKEFEELLYQKGIRNLTVNRPFKQDPQDWLLENVSPELLQSKSKLLAGFPDSPIGKRLAVNALVKEIAGGPGRVNLKFKDQLTEEEKADNAALQGKEVPSETATSIIRKALQKSDDGVADLTYLDREARTNLYFSVTTGINPELKDDPNFWKSVNALLGTGYLPVQLEMFQEQGKNQRSVAEQANNVRQDLLNFRKADVFKNSRAYSSFNIITYIYTWMDGSCST